MPSRPRAGCRPPAALGHVTSARQHKAAGEAAPYNNFSRPPASAHKPTNLHTYIPTSTASAAYSTASTASKASKNINGINGIFNIFINIYSGYRRPRKPGNLHRRPSARLGAPIRCLGATVGLMERCYTANPSGNSALEATKSGRTGLCPPAVPMSW